MSIQKCEVSFYQDVYKNTPCATIDFADFIAGVKIGKWEDKVLAFRTGRIKKELLPCITSSGVFEKRGVKGILSHSGIINIDIDKKDNPGKDLLSMRDELFADPYTHAGHLSVSGDGGLSLYFKINPKKHLESYFALEKHFANKYGIAVDDKAKDLPRLRIVSYDPEAYYNAKSKKWDAYVEQSRTPPISTKDYITSESDFNFVMNQITSGAVNISEDYHEWMKIGMAIASEYGEGGRSHFHNISRYSSKYKTEECDKKYNNILKTGSGKVNIATFFFYAKQAGMKIKSPRTEQITKVAKMRMKAAGKNGGSQDKEQAKAGAKKYLREIEKIEGKDVDQIIDKVAELSDQDLAEKTKLQQKIDACLTVIKEKELKLNEITGNIEGSDGIVTDGLVNSYYLDAVAMDDGIRKETFTTVLFSNRIPKFDPFKDFIEKNKHLKPQGNIDKLLATLNDRMMIYDNDSKQYANLEGYKDVFVRKWLLSIMGSIHGTYSLMILVLTGKQMTEKTNWFRGLLPDELRGYYGESKLDAGKDDEILMTQKLLICDDEFGGKSKQEAKKLKDLSSKQYFSIRRPYAKIPEDIRRIAVLCGTSNDDEVLNDPTGNRRIIPLKIESINRKDYEKIDKKDLFIELYHEWRKSGDEWMLTPEEVSVLNQSTEAHEAQVLEAELIQRYCYMLNDYEHGLSSTDVKVELEKRTMQKLTLYKIGQNLKKMGYEKKAVKINKNTTKQVWNIGFQPVTELQSGNSFQSPQSPYYQ